jgi:hypothetical protein
MESSVTRMRPVHLAALALSVLLGGSCMLFWDVPVPPHDGYEEGEENEDTSAETPDLDVDEPGGDDTDGEEPHCLTDADCRDDNLCNGQEACEPSTGACVPGTPLEDGFVCGAEPRRICLDETCEDSVCGDGFIDTGAGEFCDPPDGDTCTDDCRQRCTIDEECLDDGNVCNGEEYCNVETRLCGSRNPPNDGAECSTSPRRICLSGVCQDSICGDGFPDGAADVPEQCDDGNAVQGDGCDNDCTYSCVADGDCEDGDVCSEDSCDTSSHTCGHAPAPPGAVCRPVAGDCDVEETCDGVSASCPPDGFRPGTVMCRASAGVCDVEDRCTGSSASCPPDGFQPSSLVCRAASGACDAAERCTGSSAACPSDGFLSGSSVCRASAGPCDAAETCTGGSRDCPPDGYAPTGTLCRASAGVCDVEETCGGTSVACPADAFRPSTTVCRPQGSSCDIEERCTGGSAACPPDATNCLSNGNPCSSPGQCASGYCVDGVCCQNACTGVCNACNLPGLAGTCSPVTADGAAATAEGCTAGDEGCRLCSSGSCTVYTSGAHGCPPGTYCNGSGNCSTVVCTGDTDWGAGPSGCNAANQRCSGTSCITCADAGGYFLDYCWYTGATGQSCTTVCSSHGGVAVSNCQWGSAYSGYCDVCRHFHPSITTCGSELYGPGYSEMMGTCISLLSMSMDVCSTTSTLSLRYCGCRR